MTKNEFLKWEIHSRDTIDFKRIYADITKDVLAGLLLSQLMFWHLPSKKGESRMEIEKDGELWVRKKRNDWWDECRLSPKQFDRAATILKEKDFIISKNYKHEGRKTKHMRLNIENVISAIEKFSAGSVGSPNGKRSYPKRVVTIPQTGSVVTPNGNRGQGQEPQPASVSGDENLQTTSETTTEITTKTTLRNGKCNVGEKQTEQKEKNSSSSYSFLKPDFRKEDCKLYSSLCNRNNKFSLADFVPFAGDVKKFCDRVYRYKNSFGNFEYLDALKLYDALLDDSQHKIAITEYIDHEWQKWDFSATKNEEVVKGKFILEYILWHPVYQHFCACKKNGLLKDDIEWIEKRHKKVKSEKDSIWGDIPDGHFDN